MSPANRNRSSNSQTSSSASPTNNNSPKNMDICVVISNNNNKNNKNKALSIEGCQKCGLDNDHSNLLLCETCNDEYHIYCLDPPLTSVPEGDFFCHKCKQNLQIFTANNNDELDQKVSSLSPSFTQRFGEIIWAAGGNGFGWWPACVYDPRLTVGGARKLALKHIGKKHLVYFFGCPDAPFTVLPENKCMAWIDGLMEDFDEGKTAKTVGKNRSMMFDWALQAATAENDKPIECRLDWNHEEDPFVTGGVVVGSGGIHGGVNESNTRKRSLTPANRNQAAGQNDKKQRSNSTSNDLIPTRRSNRSIKPSSIIASIQDQKETEKKLKTKKSSQKEQSHQQQLSEQNVSSGGVKTNRQSINDAMVSMHHEANQIEETFDSEHDDQFFCKILRKVNITKHEKQQQQQQIEDEENAYIVHDSGCDVNIGFVTLSKSSSTFADARKKILSEIDDDMLTMSITPTPAGKKKNNNNWKFYIPHLGPMSKKQETKYGCMYDMLMRNGDGRIGNGTSRHPLKVIIYDC